MARFVSPAENTPRSAYRVALSQNVVLPDSEARPFTVQSLSENKALIVPLLLLKRPTVRGVHIQALKV